LEAQEKIDSQVMDIFGLIRIKFGNETLVIITVFLLGLYIALSAGKAEATKQEEFLVTNTKPELVVLRIYGDNLICAPFDRKTGEVEESFSVLKNTGDPNLSLRFEKLGNLHIPEITPVAPAKPAPVPATTLTPTITP
jgi:hypothetical protein